MTHKKFEELKDDIRKAVEANTTAELEIKLTERINDAVKVLTRTMADRHETKKNFRVLDKQVKNVFEILMYYLQTGNN